MNLSTGLGLSMLWCLLMQLFLSTSAFSKLDGNVTDKLSLLEFKSKLNDPLGVLNSWNESLHFCKWHGVTCGRRHQRVIKINIKNSKLGGQLSPHIGNLSFLKILDLMNNSFIHEIPQEIGGLFRLQHLRLDFNSLSGKIPVNISGCSRLQDLLLQENNLTGEIPKGMNSLPHLKTIAFAVNKLHGEIPSSIGNLSNSLEIFNVESNYLHGSIPSSFDQLKRLNYLSLGENNLTGIIPQSIYNLSSIKFFSVQTNKLEGNLPHNLGHLLPNLQTFYFHTNQFKGPVPIISNASKLVDFQILSNQFTGKVPDFHGLPNLKILLLHFNNLGYGEDDDLKFLCSLVNLTNLEQLAISQNNLGGVLPECIGNMSAKLWLFMLGSNEIKGSIPTGIGNLLSLQGLGLEDNQLIGHIPSSIAKLQNLYELDLHSNNIAGTVPSSLGNLTSLNVLALDSNNLQGKLPSSLGGCRNLRELDVSRNNLSGPIPKEVIGNLASISEAFVFSHNYFSGSISNEVGKLVQLVHFDISENKLSGAIPETIGSCGSLQRLYFEGNLLQGTIPHSFNSLKGIEEMDLSRNNLFGEIPTYLEGLHMKKLNLSFNNFEGPVPTKGVFTNMSAISVVGNKRLCGGIAQLNIPKCPSGLNKKTKLSKKRKFTISVVCGLVAIMSLALLLALLCWRRKRKGKTILGSPFGISFLEVSYGDLLKATNAFSSTNLIGIGSSGSVYKGILNQEGQLEVAVKVLNLQTSRALKSFIAECKVLKSIKHRNLVKILTACSSIDFQGNDFKALVYEFMINGSLEEWLHPTSGMNLAKTRPLNLIERINIAIDVANALHYLHHHCHVPVVHCDLKPSSSNQSSSIGIRGSIGYIAPEYVMGNELSRDGDVYSYGIFLLEMFTGKRPTDKMFKDDFNLHNFVKMSWPERLVQVVDLALLIGTDQVEERAMEREIGRFEIENEEDNINNSQLIMNAITGKCLHSVLKIGISCSEESPNKRMNVGDVIKELLHVKTALMGAEIRGDQN